jgi:hypothetical protein
LRQENAELRRAHEILKTASAFSPRPSSTVDSSDRGPLSAEPEPTS